jgi:hypothetical protein
MPDGTKIEVHDKTQAANSSVKEEVSSSAKSSVEELSSSIYSSAKEELSSGGHPPGGKLPSKSEKGQSNHRTVDGKPYCNHFKSNRCIS